MKRFTRETVDPILYSENGIRGDVVQRTAFWEEAADERILLLIEPAFIGRSKPFIGPLIL